MIANFGKFDRAKHVYVNEAFTELIKDALRFFHGTPILPLPPAEPFVGAGVYAIYCTARTGLYGVFGNGLNRTNYDVPIYVGKAVPSGWRQHREANASAGMALYARLRQHTESIRCGKG